MSSFLDDWLNLSPDAIEKQRIFYEKRKAERKMKIKEAVKKENLEISIREYPKVGNGENSRQKFTIFLSTYKGVEYSPCTLGKIDFTLHYNVDLKDVFIAAKKQERLISGYMDKLLHFDLVVIYDDYRTFGLSEYLLSYFIDLYEEKYTEFPISVEFMNPIAEFTMKRLLKEKGMAYALNESLIQRYYYQAEKVDDLSLINVLKIKDNNIFPLESTAYLCEMKF